MIRNIDENTEVSERIAILKIQFQNIHFINNNLLHHIILKYQIVYTRLYLDI